MCTWKEILMIFGGVSLLGISLIFGVLAFEFIKDGIRTLKHRYRYKHRFDKPPTAKCYCIDCKWHDNESGRCYRFHENTNRRTADNWFCYSAEPKEKEE